MVDRTIGELIMEYFQDHPNEYLEHGPVVDWVEEQFVRLYGKKPRDPWRQIRKLHQQGKLIKARTGVYRFDPDRVKNAELFDFPPNVKEAIFRRDNYRCVVCGKGRAEGVEICADHIKPKDKEGTNTEDNGQTLCMQHNLLKKNYSQTEAGKKYFIRLYLEAISKGDQRTTKFCRDILDVYDKHEVNGHIRRPDV